MRSFPKVLLLAVLLVVLPGCRIGRAAVRAAGSLFDSPRKVAKVEQPVKKDDHLLDALRYAVMSRPYLPILRPENTETELETAMRKHRERGKRKPGLASVGR